MADALTIISSEPQLVASPMSTEQELARPGPSVATARTFIRSTLKSFMSGRAHEDGLVHSYPYRHSLEKVC